jgi:DNA-binding response OmpR family regulator
MIRARLLVAEDDDELRRLLASAFRRDGHEVHEAKDGHELLEAFAETIRETEPEPSFDVIISDIRLPGPTGLQVLAEIHALRSAPPMILITAFGDEETHLVARFLGSAAILDKPFDIDELRFEVARALGWA